MTTSTQNYLTLDCNNDVDCTRVFIAPHAITMASVVKFKRHRPIV